MTHIIIAQHNHAIYRIVYRNRNIIRICKHLSDADPRGQEVQYDHLSLEERESILISIIDYLNEYTNNAT